MGEYRTPQVVLEEILPEWVTEARPMDQLTLLQRIRQRLGFKF